MMTIHRRSVIVLSVCLLVSLLITLPVNAASESADSVAQNDDVTIITAGEKNDAQAADAPATEPVEEVIVSPTAEDGKTDKTSKDKKSTIEDSTSAPEAETLSTMSESTFTSTEESEEESVAPLFLENATFTGAAIYSIPIKVPPGRNKIQPDLKLLYNSFQKNGWLGLGWSLDMGSIKRSTRFGLNYTTKDFQYEINGSINHLSAMADGDDEYFSREIEGEFTKFFYNSSTDGWEAHQKNGIIKYFGSNEASRIETTHGTFQWCLDRIEDPNGNFMTVAYTTDQGQIYLSEINYTKNGSLQHDKRVVFYLENRPDTVLPHQAHSQIKTAKRLKTIAVQANNLLVQAYEIKYDQDGAPFTAHSQIVEVKEYGSDASVDTNGNITGGTSLPSTVFEWKNNPVFSFVRTSNAITKSEIDDGRGLYYGDWNGDGKTDVMWWKRSNGSNYWYLNEGNGSFSSPIINPIEKDHLDNHGSLYFGDWDGDGKTDVMWWHRDPGNNRWFINDGNCNFTEFINPIDRKKINNYGNLYFGDWNGDGTTDVMWFRPENGNNRWFINNGNCGFVLVENPIPPGTVDGSDRVVYFGDWNGDGITDFLWRNKETGANKWYTNDGTCQFVLTQDPVPRDLINNFGSLHFGDWNGDGISDFMRFKADSGSNRWFINDGNLDFSIYLGDPVPRGQIDNSQGKLHLGDWNGDGITDFMWLNPDTGANKWYTNDGTCHFGLADTPVPKSQIDGGNGLAFGDWNGDGITDFMWYNQTSGENDWHVNGQTHSFLITAATTPQHAAVSLEYTPSSHYDNVRLTSVMQTLSQVSVNDGLGNLSVAELSYSGGLYNFNTREFRGFETVTRTNPDDTIVKTRYHQGRFKKGRVLEEKLWAKGANPDTDTPLVATANTWETEYLNAPDNTSAFVKLSQTRSDYNDAVTAFTQQDFTYDSTNGNLLTVTASGTGAENVTTVYDWQNYGDWLWRKTKQTLTGATTGKLRESWFEYEPSTGNLLALENWLSTGANPRTTFQYDAYGNVTHATDPRNNTTVTEYDTVTATYPVKITYPATNGVNHIVEMAWDARYGKKLWDKDENGNFTYYAYDPFGRIAQTDLPDGGQATVDYFDEVIPRYTVTRVKEDAAGNTIDSYRYVDGLNREVQTVAFGEGGKTIVTKSFYDEMGRPSLKQGPFFATGTSYPQTPPAEYPWQQVSYDDRSRPRLVESPHDQYPDGIKTEMVYSGFDVTITDPDGSVKTEKRDYLERIIQMIENNGAEQYLTNYAYNAAGELTSVTDHQNNVTSVSWDTLGRKTAMDDPDMGAWSYTYDANGNMLTQTDAKSQTITFSYDELNRVTYKSYSTSDPTDPSIDPAVAYLYDDTTPGKNGIGRLSSVESSAAIITYESYDAMGRLLEETKKISGEVTVYTSAYAYDLSGKKIQTIHPDNFTVDYGFYAGTNLLHTVTGTGATRFATLTQYAPNGKIGRIDHGNDTFTTYSYDPLSEKLTNIVTKDNLDIEIQNRAYLYSRAGDIEEIADAVNGVTYNYTYDDLHRLTGRDQQRAGRSQ
jgi:YD repeat-containing protein